MGSPVGDKRDVLAAPPSTPSPAAHAEVHPHPADSADAAPFAPDAELTVLLPERSVPLTEERRGLVQTLLWLADDDGIVTRVDEQHAIASLRVPLDANKLRNLDSTLQLLGIRDPSTTLVAGGSKKKSRVVRALDWAGGELKTWWPLIGAVIGTVFVLFPALKPDEPPKSRGVTVSNVAVEDWSGSALNGAAADSLSFDVSFEGYRGEEINIYWVAFDAVSKRRVELGGAFDGGTDVDTTGKHHLPQPLKASAAADRGTETFTVPLPFQSECIFVRVYASAKSQPTPSPTKEAKSSNPSQTVEPLQFQWLDYADSPPFNTHKADDPSCPGGESGTTETKANGSATGS